MSTFRRYRFFAIVAVLAALSGCATSRILKCEGHLVPINPAPPKPAMAVTSPARKSQSARHPEQNR